MKRRCVTEDNLVKTQLGLRTIITSLALVAVCLPVFAQQPVSGLQPIPANSPVAPAPNPVVNPTPGAQMYPDANWESGQVTNGNTWQPNSAATPMVTAPGNPQVACPTGGCPTGGCPGAACPTCPTGAGPGLGAYTGCCQEEDCCPPAWYLRQGTKIMHRSATRGIQMTQQRYVQQVFDATTGGLVSESVGFTPIFNTKMIKFDVAAGYDVTLGHYLGRDCKNRDHFIEFNYYGLNDWVERRDIRANQRTEQVQQKSSTGNLQQIITTYGLLYSYAPSEVVLNTDQGTLLSTFVPSTGFAEAITGFNRAEQHWISYESRWDNFEMNLRVKPRRRAKDRLVLYPNGRWRRECQVGWRPEYIVGLRGFSFDEWFYFAGRNRTTGTAGDYRIRTHNDAFGFQIGMDLKYRYRKMDWGFKTKVAPVLNFAEQVSQLSATGAENDTFANAENIAFRTWSATKDKAACVLELGVGVDYHIYPNMKLYAGYDMMWAFGLALAPEQISWNPNTAPWISAGGKTFFQSLNLGVELVW